MITFGAPMWLAALAGVLPLILLLMWRTARLRRKLLETFTSGQLIAGLTASWSPGRQRLKNTLLVLGLTPAILALARPQWGFTWQESRGRGIDILFALDASRSMLAEDISPNRLERSKLAIRSLVSGLGGDRVGLIAFAGDAFLQCPLTLDYDAFTLSLDAVEPDIMARGGTNIAAAIREAEAAFAANDNFRFLVLITDGEDLAEKGLEVARKAGEGGIRIFTIGVGSESGEPIPIRDDRGNLRYVRDATGDIVTTRLDADTLRSIAGATDALYQPLGPTGEGLRTVYNQGLADIPPEERESRTKRVPVERYPWFLGAAIACLAIELLIGTRRRNATIPTRRTGPALVGVLAIGLATPTGDDPLHAQTVTVEPEASPARETGPTPGPAPAEALPEVTDPRLIYNQGVALYRSGNYKGARERFEAALPAADLDLQADAFFNLSNTWYRIGVGAREEGLDPAGLVSAIDEQLAAGREALAFGNTALDRIPLRKQAWERCEQARNKLQASLEQAAGLSDRLEPVRQAWREARRHLANAAELDPEAADIRRNQRLLRERLGSLEGALDTLAGQREPVERMITDLEAMIEKLKTPTARVRETLEKARELLSRQRYREAYELMTEVAEEDPTAAVYQDLQQRAGQIAGIVEKHEPAPSQP
ncbi:MAG: VWA domain-containing protein [Opitutales bacterium]